MYFKPYTLKIEGKPAQVSHIVANMIKVLYEKKEILLILDLDSGKPVWSHTGKVEPGLFKKITEAINEHNRPKKR